MDDRDKKIKNHSVLIEKYEQLKDDYVKLKKKHSVLKTKNTLANNGFKSIKDYWSEKSVELYDKIEALDERIRELNLSKDEIIAQKDNEIALLKKRVSLNRIAKKQKDYDMPMKIFNI